MDIDRKTKMIVLINQAKELLEDNYFYSNKSHNICLKLEEILKDIERDV